jgi:hypothetical protein
MFKGHIASFIGSIFGLNAGAAAKDVSNDKNISPTKPKRLRSPNLEARERCSVISYWLHM